eukprot:11692943-Heterocapsa_arctica.AAC.1
MKWTPWMTEGRARGKAPRGEQLEGGAAPTTGEEDATIGPMGARMPMLPARSARGNASTKLNISGHSGMRAARHL